jgi:hypothetical protein
MPSPLALISDQRDHLITRVDHILKLEVEVTPRRKPVPPVSPYALVPVVDPHDVVGQPSDHSRRIPFNLRVIELEGPLMLAVREPLQQVRTISTFSCDIAYSESPAASRAFAWSKKYSILVIRPSRIV